MSASQTQSQSRGIRSGLGGMLSATQPDRAFWNYESEQRIKKYTLAGGVPKFKAARNAIHRVYFRKFRRSQFPNRTRAHWAVVMKGPFKQRPVKLPWAYDVSSMIFNQTARVDDKIGYVTSTGIKTAVVSVQKLVFYPKYSQKVAKTWRFFAHDEDLACVPGDLVHIRTCRRISKYKNNYVFSILEPNVEGRERLKLGLPAVAPPLFGYPNSRRVVKLNLSSEEGAKRKTAAALQEQLQDFYRYAGRVSENAPQRLEDDGDTYDDVAKMIAGNAPATDLEAGETLESIGSGSEDIMADFNEADTDSRFTKGEDTWMKREPAEKYDYTTFTKSP